MGETSGLPRSSAPYLRHFAEVLRSIELLEGFALVPVEIASSEIVGAMADWIERHARKVHRVEPMEGRWSTLPATLFALPTTPDSVVVLIGNDDDTPDVRMGLHLLNPRRDSLAVHLGCPLLWCGPPGFLNRTEEIAPDFWSIREIPRRIEVVPDLSRVAVRAEAIPESASSIDEVRSRYDAAKEQGDAPNTARIGLRLARGLLAQRQLDEAVDLAQEARALFEKMPAARGAAGAAESEEVLGDASRVRGKMEEAEAHYHNALQVAEQVADVQRMASAERGLGMAARAKGELNVAESWHRKALSLLERLGDERGIAASHSDLAGIAWDRRDLGEAEAQVRKALALFEKLGDDNGSAMSHTMLGNIAGARRDTSAAQRAHDEASRTAPSAGVNELRILFARSSNGALTYRIATSWGGDADEPQPFEPILTDDDYADLGWYLEEYMDFPTGGAKVRAERIEGRLPEWGRKLFDCVFALSNHRELYNALLDGPSPRLLTVGTRDLDVLRLPWELMEDRRGPLTRRGVVLRRQLENARLPDRYDVGKLPLRILLVVSRPDDAGFVDPRHTTRAMLDALTPLGDAVLVDFCRPATVDRMDRMLRDADRSGRPYHVVHFDGPGTFLPAAQIGALYFEKNEDAAGVITKDFVRADRIRHVFASYKIPVVILEASRSGQLGSVTAFRGVAPALLEAGAGSVLAMSHAVHVEATRILFERFYEEVCDGASIGQAVEQGRAAMMANPDRWLVRGPASPTVALNDWFVPQLYQRAGDPILVPGGAARALRPLRMLGARRRPAMGDEPGAFPRKPMYGFFGRAKELHQIERRFLGHRAVLLHAMGGMGKTSLAREVAFWGSRTGLFPDGACFVSFEQAGGAERVVQVLGAHFEGANFEKRPTEEQKRRAKELFQTKQVLMVWDNFESVLPAFQEGEAVPLYSDEDRAEICNLFRSWTEDERGLGRLLVTCRPGETGLGAVCKVELGGLARADALSLLSRVMQLAGVARTYEREELVALLKAVEMHPLSIELVGPHLKNMGPEEIVADFQRLLDGFKGEAEVERNRSLRASIGFSLMRLSKEGREAVRWLGLFRGGVFEVILLDVSQMDPKGWEEAQGELEATALVGVEREMMLAGKPHPRFHPTLAVEAGDRAIEAGVRERYVGVYLAVGAGIDKALGGSNPRGGMDVMIREEANLRRAVDWALEQGAYDRASAMGGTLREYLERAGRLGERDRWAAWLAGEVRKGGFSNAVAEREMDEAWALLSQGEPRKGIEKLEALVARLRTTTEFDAAFALAKACSMLGRVYDAVGWAQKAVPVLKDAVRQWEALIDKEQAAGTRTDAERGNLATTLGDLANALGDAGVLDEALTAAEQGIAISRERGDYRRIAAGVGRTAQVLMMQGRYADADVRYDEALQAAQRAGDRELEGTTLQTQGILAYERGQLDRAAKLYQRALQLFQDMHDEGSVMRTCNLLGMAEQNAGRLADARAWYERSREIAARRGDQQAMGAVAQNLGVVYQIEGEAARKQGDEARARERFTEAVRTVNEALRVRIESRDTPREAESHGQLARIHLLLGDLDEAGAHAHQAREIRERLGLKEAWKDYDTLADIARARNNPTDAAAWEQKRDTLLAELRRRAGAPALPQQALQAIAQLALACAQAGLAHAPLGAGEEEALATLATWPAPLDTLVPFLRALAAGDLPALPASLPRDVVEGIEPVLAAVREARAR